MNYPIFFDSKNTISLFGLKENLNFLSNFPETSEKGSRQPTTTLGILCLIINSAQAGVFPKCAQGSRLT